MSYAGSGEASSIVVANGSAEKILLGSGVVAHLVAPGSLTNERFGLFRWDMPAGSGGPKPHFHRAFSESFFVLSGAVELWTGSAWSTGTAGDYLYVPEGGIHAFRNDGDAPASMLILFAPGAPRERYFEELAELGRSGRQLAPEEWTDLYARHDQFMV